MLHLSPGGKYLIFMRSKIPLTELLDEARLVPNEHYALLYGIREGRTFQRTGTQANWMFVSLKIPSSLAAPPKRFNFQIHRQKGLLLKLSHS